MATRRRHTSRRVTSVPLTTLGSGARLIDLFPVPIPLYVLFKTFKYVIKHWYIFLTVTLFILAAQPLDQISWVYPILVLFIVPALSFGYLAVHNRHHRPVSVARAGLHLARTRLRWTTACDRVGLNDGTRRPKLIGYMPWDYRPPRIANPDGSALEFTLNLSPIGQTTYQLEEAREYLAANLGARRTRIHRLSPGRARFVLEWGPNPSKSTAIINTKDQIKSSQLTLITLDENVLLELDTSLLVVGESGSGKSNLTWHVLNGLNQHTVPYKLHVIDPKKVELADLQDSPHTQRYTDNSKEIDDVIDDFHRSMMKTFNEMKSSRTRKILISNDHPLHILIIDELILCSRQLKGGATDTPLGEILSAGRAAAHIVIANSQLGQVDVIGRIRDLFPQRVCMATKSSDLTNAVLGPRSEERGARCTEITEKGVGYIYTDNSGTFQRFRPPLIEDTTKVAKGEISDSEGDPNRDRSLSLSLSIPNVLKRNKNRTRTAYVYRLFHENGDLLYIGKAINPAKRMKQHLEEQPWWHQVDHSQTTMNKYPNEQSALEAERLAIETERPRYNLLHNF